MLEHDPIAADTLREQGRALAKQGELEGAIRCFTDAVRKYPDDYAAFFLRGIAFEKLGRKDEAEADFRKTVWLKPTHVKAQQKLALQYPRQDRPSMPVYPGYERRWNLDPLAVVGVLVAGWFLLVRNMSFSQSFSVSLVMIFVIGFVWAKLSNRQTNENLVAKYGTDRELTQKLLTRQYWLGMSRKQLMDAWGDPDSFDFMQKSPTSVVAVVKYRKRDDGTFDHEFTFENGSLIGWKT